MTTHTAAVQPWMEQLSGEVLLVRYGMGERSFCQRQFVALSLFEACLTGIELTGSNLSSAYLPYVQFGRALLSSVCFDQAELSDGQFYGADLTDASLAGARLIRSDLRACGLQRANLQRSQLIGADLRNADLRNADLRGADLTGANLENALLSGADLRGCQLFRSKGAWLEGSRRDRKTINPDGYPYGLHESQ